MGDPTVDPRVRSFLDRLADLISDRLEREPRLGTDKGPGGDGLRNPNEGISNDEPSDPSV